MPSFSIQLTHNEFTFISVIMMIQSGAIWAYMLYMKSQSRAAFYLRIFFALVFLQAIVLFVVNGIDGAQAFLPFHNVSLIVAGIALIEFIHHTPRYTLLPGYYAGRVALISFLLLTSGYALYFAYQYIYHWQPGLEVDSSFWPLLPTGIVLLVLGILFRAIYFAPSPVVPLSKMAYLRVVIDSLLFPPNPGVHALRDLALALSLLVPTASIGFFHLSQNTVMFGI